MSTKNLARTVIEAGRPSESQWACKLAHRAARAEARRAMRAVVEGASADDAAFPRMRKTNRSLDDKLGAPRRWLASQVGRPWDVVRAELARRFDTRTVAGRHVIHGHMIPWVAGAHRCPYSCGQPFRVDRHGILRHAVIGAK